ncbi:hypothetical protein [Pedobacter cryoconitis]|uniref:Bulb-type lectin domain-containing protein n=1 Tax=Pedobacter cryoconitis TaxID=188932 RepID=A0A327S4Q4_9SPHI|nr:hypothetical protein [Pedobacter cryoconitis]RAJ20687.1 hypothetical protein LY11_05180 [Pedobacter cryoconitis]
MTYKKLIAAFTFSFILLFFSSANAAVNLISFTIQNSYLAGGTKLNVQYDKSQSFTANFKFTKSGNYFNTVKVYLVYKENTTVTVLGEAKWKYNGDWVIGDPYSWEGTIDGVLPKGKTTGSVFLYYQSFEGDNAGGVAESMNNYSIYVSNSPVTPPVKPPVEPYDPTKDDKNSFIDPSLEHRSWFSSDHVGIAVKGTYHLDAAQGNLFLYNGTQLLWTSQGRKDQSGWTVRFTADGSIIWQSSGRASLTWAGRAGAQNVVWRLGEDGNFAAYANSTKDSNLNITLGEKIAETATSGGVVSTKGFFLNL